MPTTKQRVDRLENALIELAEAQKRTEASMEQHRREVAEAQKQTEASIKALSTAQKRTEAYIRQQRKELTAAQKRTDAAVERLSARVEAYIQSSSVEMKAMRNEMNAKWGEMVNRLGTLVEDIVAPNIPRIAREYFGWGEMDFFAVRVKVANKGECSRSREFDVIAVGEKGMIVNEAKSIPKIDYINEFIEALNQIGDYFPEHRDKRVIPIFASLYLDESVVKYLTRQKIYAMAMGEYTMEIINFRQVTE